jgi:hypothetical protein
VNPKKIKSGPGKQRMEGKDFRLAKEIKYIQQQAAKHDGRFVTIGPLVFFSTETGDAWMLEPSCQLAARLARDGDPEPIDFQETDTNYAIGWKGNYRIEGRVRQKSQNLADPYHRFVPRSLNPKPLVLRDPPRPCVRGNHAEAAR